MNHRNITFNDITAWMIGEADEVTRAAIRDELSRTDSASNRHLAWMSDPTRRETGELDPLVEPLVASLDVEQETTVSAILAWVQGRSGRQVFALAATLLVGATIGLVTAKVTMRAPVGRPPGDASLFELHVNESSRPATWDEIWVDNVSGRDTASANVDRLRRASGEQVKAIIDDFRAKGREDFEILTALKATFGPVSR